jgi:hypothetical protein
MPRFIFSAQKGMMNMRYNSLMMLGREKSPHDERTLSLSNILTVDEIKIPDAVNWGEHITEWGVMGNDRYGNCVIVTKGHMIMTWVSSLRHKDDRISDEDVVTESRSLGALKGFNILSSLKIWRKRGILSEKIWAFADIRLDDTLIVQAAIFYFGCIEIGVNLPLAWKGADTWDTGNGRDYRPGSWGPHSVPIVGYDVDYVFVVSWGELIPMTWRALREYCDEAFVAISVKWLSVEGNNPAGLNLELIHQKLLEIEKTVFE